MTRLMHRLRVLAPLLIVLSALGSSPVRAAGTNIAVTTNSDELTVDGNCSLREAISAANTDTAVDACPAGNGPDTITLPEGTYGLSIEGMSDDANQTGDLDLTSDLALVGAGSASTIIDAHEIDRVLDVPGSADIRLAGLTLTGGLAVNFYRGNERSDGGAIDNVGGTVRLTDVAVTGNRSADLYVNAAGIANGGTMTIARSVVAGNVAFGGAAGGILNSGTLSIEDSTIEGNSNLVGGGIANDGTLVVARSTIANNSASETDYSSPAGGGLYNSGTATLINATVSGNNAGANLRSHADGAGIFNVGLLRVIDGTIANNSDSVSCFPEEWCAAAGHDAGIAGPATLSGTIVAGNTWAFDDIYDGLPPFTGPADCSAVTSLGGNVIGSTSECVVTGASGTDRLYVDPLLGPLADNGGPTMTHAVLAGSPAIDLVPVGSNGCGTTITTDQRGITRPQGTGCDSGAYETVQRSFSGFFAPVRNAPAVNLASAGSAVPIRFSLGNDEGLDIFAPGSPQSRATSCVGGAPTGPLESTVSAGASGLTYDPASDHYTYVWKTDKTWAATCRQIVLTLADGTVQGAMFRFR